MRENCTSRLSERAEAGRTLDLSRLYSVEAGVMLVERRVGTKGNADCSKLWIVLSENHIRTY